MNPTDPTRAAATPRPRRGRRPSRVPTPARLERWALHHLERYATSSANLRAVLMRRVERSAEELGTDVAAVEEEIDALILRLHERGYLDDRAFARGLAKRLRARGGSSQVIRARLAAKGVADDISYEILQSPDEDADLEAAWRYARRRGLGPYRSDAEARQARRERDLAAFARAGFEFGVASRVVDAPGPEDPV